MPIKPENRARYPVNWAEIRAAILQRAGNCCEWPGCGVANHAIGYWQGPSFVKLCMKDEAPNMDIEAAELADGFKVIEIVLTIAHRDHIPEHCEPENLAAWCQRHHLAYDHHHHITNAYMTRKARANTLELPL